MPPRIFAYLLILYQARLGFVNVIWRKALLTIEKGEEQREESEEKKMICFLLYALFSLPFVIFVRCATSNIAHSQI